MINVFLELKHPRISTTQIDLFLMFAGLALFLQVDFTQSELI